VHLPRAPGIAHVGVERGNDVTVRGTAPLSYGGKTIGQGNRRAILNGERTEAVEQQDRVRVGADNVSDNGLEHLVQAVGGALIKAGGQVLSRNRDAKVGSSFEKFLVAGLGLSTEAKHQRLHELRTRKGPLADNRSGATGGLIGSVGQDGAHCLGNV